MKNSDNRLKWKSDAAATVSGFDFNHCDRILELSISETGERIFLDACFHYHDEGEGIEGKISFRFLNLLMTNISFATTKMWLTDFFVSYDENGFCVFDEMSSLRWMCESIQFVHFLKTDKGGGPVL